MLKREENLLYQLNWQTLPGLKGLSCSNFRAVATSSPDVDRGVAFDCASEAECAALLQRLEAHFGAQRFSNSAAAFEAVKAYVLDRSPTGR
ncbi:MAG: hypothetical protein ACYDCD_14030 [Candidatus Acidiferrales bacterium]